jgi:hypothetical protein
MTEPARPQINASKLVVSGGIIGAIFTVGSMLIFLTGLPILRYMFPAALLLGCGIALCQRLIRHKTPGAPWLRSAIEKGAELPLRRDIDKKQDLDKTQDLDQSQDASQGFVAIYVAT